jgi:nucleotide-binding universal stress UspA family protein
MFKRIIVAIDGSDHSYQALIYTRNLAECFGATLWLVHAFPHTSDLLGYEEYANLVARRESAGQVILDEARWRLGEVNFAVHEELMEGPAAEAILSVAETRQADLIVMGTRGLSSLQGLLLGSVSNKVIHHASCPVMLIR